MADEMKMSESTQTEPSSDASASADYSPGTVLSLSDYSPGSNIPGSAKNRVEDKVLSEEYSASQIRGLLQQLFPTRRLVLSQFTFFNQVGVARATGKTSRRGRRCYRLEDLLSIACILALKEEGIPLKNIDQVPALIQENVLRIFREGEGCKISGFGPNIRLMFPGDAWEYSALEHFFSDPTNTLLFWSYDVGMLARQLKLIAEGELEKGAGQRLQRAA